MFVFSFINITHGPSCCCHPSLPGVFSNLVHRLIQNKQHIHPLFLTVLWLFVPQGSSQGRSLRAGGDLPAGGGGQPVRGPGPAGQLRLQRLAFGCPGHLPRWIPAYLKPGWRGQQRGVNPAISLWHHPSSSAVARPQSVQNNLQWYYRHHHHVIIGIQDMWMVWTAWHRCSIYVKVTFFWNHTKLNTYTFFEENQKSYRLRDLWGKKRLVWLINLCNKKSWM